MNELNRPISTARIISTDDGEDPHFYQACLTAIAMQFITGPVIIASFGNIKAR